MFFKKNPTESRDEIIQKMQQEEENPSLDQTPKNEPKLKDNEKLAAEVEKLKAQIEASEELRKLYNEKFAKLDQDIGEFRNMIIERDKEMHELEVKATKAADIVAEVKPETVQATVTKFETRIEMVKTKLEANEQINDKIIEELKEIRNTVKAFRGINEIEKLTKEMLEEQAVTKRIQGKIEAYADKAESIYMEMDKKYEEFRHFKDVIEDIDTKLINENKSIKELRIKVDEERRTIDTQVENSKKETAKMKIYNDVLEELKQITKNQNNQILSLNQEILMIKKQNEITQEKNKETLIRIHSVLIQLKQRLI